jgi:hypothetical protein
LTKEKGEDYNRVNILWAQTSFGRLEHLWFRELDIVEEATSKPDENVQEKVHRINIRKKEGRGMKLKRILACTLSAAMLVTTASFANLGVGTAYAAAENDQIVTAKGLAEIDSAILMQNAKAKSEQNPVQGQDGLATWAFDDQDHWWHTKWQNEQNNEGHVSASNPIWIQTGFDEVKKIKKITYQSRDTKMGCINGYKVQYANVSGEPQDSDFQDVPGAAGNLQSVNTEQEIVFNTAVDATHIRLVATSVHTNGGTPHVAAKRIRVFEETNVTYDLSKQTEFWDYELSKGTLGIQTADDRWHYQVRRSGAWEDLPESALKNFNGAGGKSWMNNGNDQDGTYHWAKLNRDELTSTFANTYDALAFSWKAPAAGYYKATLENTITEGNGINSVVWHSSDTANGKELFNQQALGVGGMIDSKIAKVNTGDWIRIGATADDKWVKGFHPMIVTCTVQDYARQYLTEIEGVEEGQNYTVASKQAVKNAREALRTAVEVSEPNMGDIEAKLAVLEEAVKGLKLHVPVAGVRLDQSALTLKVNETAALVATVEPEGAENKAVTWESNNAGVASVSDGTVTATGVGTAVITVKSAENQELTATCTVTVQADKTELSDLIAEANKLQAENYETTAWEEFRATVTEAETVRDNVSATEQMVSDAVLALNDALIAVENHRVYKVTVVNGETSESAVVDSGAYGKYVTVTAPKASEGQVFAGWKNGEVTVSTKESYSFYLVGDVTLTATYQDAGQEVVQEPGAMLSNVLFKETTTGKYRVSFVCQLSVPEGYELEEAGIFWSKTSLDSLHSVDGNAVSGARKVNAKSTNRQYQYTININNVPSGFTLYQEVFAKVKNTETGAYSWVYTTVKPVTVP